MLVLNHLFVSINILFITILRCVSLELVTIFFSSFFSPPVALQPNMGHGLLILEVFLDHTQWCITVGRTPLDEWSACHRDLYLTTHNTHNRQTSMPLVGFKPTISAGERLQTYALDRVATGTGWLLLYWHKILNHDIEVFKLALTCYLTFHPSSVEEFTVFENFLTYSFFVYNIISL
jgi:hypothetical protein